VPLTRGLLEVVGSPASAWTAIIGAVAFTALVLYLAARKVRRMDLAYGGE
jgi:ABC-type antimicrobial peptide transport system permease subunit